METTDSPGGKPSDLWLSVAAYLHTIVWVSGLSVKTRDPFGHLPVQRRVPLHFRVAPSNLVTWTSAHHIMTHKTAFGHMVPQYQEDCTITVACGVLLMSVTHACCLSRISWLHGFV